MGRRGSGREASDLPKPGPCRSSGPGVGSLVETGRPSPRRATVGIQTIHETWQVRAACRGPESTMFFPPSATERKKEREARETAAKSICSTCRVQRSCLEYALEIREPHGI